MKNVNSTKGVMPATGTILCEPERARRKIFYLGPIALVAFALSGVFLKAAPMPFVWIGLTWGGAFFGGTFCLRGAWPRAVLFNCGIAAVTLAAAEAYLQPPDPISITYSDGYRVLDDVVGERPATGITAHSSRSGKGKRLYDVTYTIDPNGLRMAPPVLKDSPGCIAFFGCSFTFGEGLRDTETLPYQVGIQSGGAYRTFNFGFHGYGPQQMLAAIERDRVKQIVNCKPEIAIYQAIPHHVPRVAGKVSFGRHSPRYLLDPDGSVHLAGHFDDGEKPRSSLSLRLRWHLGRSAIYQMLREPRVSEDDIRLLLAIVRKSRDLLTMDYPGIEFHVILWKSWREDREVYRELQDGFRASHIPVHLVENILPGFDVDSPKYVLSTYDKHPNAAANSILARYVLTTIVK